MLILAVETRQELSLSEWTLVTVTFQNYTHDHHLQLQLLEQEEEEQRGLHNNSCWPEEFVSGGSFNSTSSSSSRLHNQSNCSVSGWTGAGSAAHKRDRLSAPQVSYRIVVYINGQRDIAVDYRDPVMGMLWECMGIYKDN